MLLSSIKNNYVYSKNVFMSLPSRLHGLLLQRLLSIYVCIGLHHLQLSAFRRLQWHLQVKVLREKISKPNTSRYCFGLSGGDRGP